MSQSMQNDKEYQVCYKNSTSRNANNNNKQVVQIDMHSQSLVLVKGAVTGSNTVWRGTCDITGVKGGVSSSSEN